MYCSKIKYKTNSFHNIFGGLNSSIHIEGLGFFIANKLQQRCLWGAKTWQTDCNNVADGCECAAYRLQMRGKRIATMQRSKNKNHTFVTQKPPFCTTKTILLHVKNHTFVMRICNIQKTNTLQTFRECILNGFRMRGEHTRNTYLTHHKKHTFGFLKHHSYKTQIIVAQNVNGIFSYYLKPNNNS